ncbi:MAG: PEGA domain-containing protein [Treponema sp.]|nr:PEGA domain-containing protein [Treponema sp.]
MKKELLGLLFFFSLWIPGLYAQEESADQSPLVQEEVIADEEVALEDIPFLEPQKKEELSSDIRTARLVIDCDLRAALVYLNGVYQGKTKLTIKDLLPADYILEVKKDGYQSKKYYISARSSFIHSYKIKLK